MLSTPVRCIALATTLFLLVGCQYPVKAAEPGAREASFIVFGDHGYIPSYEQLDDDEPPLRTLGEYLALEAEDWLERNPSLEGFTPTPWVFESSLGSFYQASGTRLPAIRRFTTCGPKGQPGGSCTSVRMGTN